MSNQLRPSLVKRCIETISLATLSIVVCATASAQSAFVRVNQIGYGSGQTKRAYLKSSGSETGATFTVKNSSGVTVFSGPIGANLGSWSRTYGNVYSNTPPCSHFFVNFHMLSGERGRPARRGSGQQAGRLTLREILPLAGITVAPPRGSLNPLPDGPVPFFFFPRRIAAPQLVEQDGSGGRCGHRCQQDRGQPRSGSDRLPVCSNSCRTNKTGVGYLTWRYAGAPPELRDTEARALSLHEGVSSGFRGSPGPGEAAPGDV